MSPSPLRCYSPRFLALSFAGALIIIATAMLSKSFPRGSAIRIGLAGTEAIITGVIIVTSMLKLRELDEMQQRVQLEALAIAFAGTGVLAAGYGFLVGAGLPDIDWGTLTWPAMVALWVLGLVIANRRYR